jgi:hypothetical protein
MSSRCCPRRRHGVRQQDSPGASIRNITQTVDKDNAWGYHGGVDVTYLLTSRVGVSATMRYSHASHHAVNRLANTDDLEDTGIWGMGDTTEVVAMDHGGFHWNGGVTFRF